MMKVLRWILFFPGATAASVLAAFLGYSAAALADNTLAQVSAAFFSTLVFVSVAGFIAPAGRKIVTLTISGIITLTAIAAFLTSEFTTWEPYASMSPALKILIPVSQIVACVFAILAVQRLSATGIQGFDSQTLFSLFGCLVGMAMMVSAVAVYIVSVYQAYDSGGKWGYVAIPLLGQMFWFIVRWKFFGFFNSYTYLCLAFLISGICFQIMNDAWLAKRRNASGV